MAWCVPAPSPLDRAWTTPVLALGLTPALTTTPILAMVMTMIMVLSPVRTLTVVLTLTPVLLLAPASTLFLLFLSLAPDRFLVMVMDLERTLVRISTLTLNMTSTVAMTPALVLPPALTPPLTLNLILTLTPPLTLALARVLLLVMAMVPARTLALVARLLTVQQERLMNGLVSKPARAHPLGEERLPRAGDLVLQLRPWTARLSANDHAQRSQRAFVLVPLSGHAGATAKQLGPRRPFWPW